MSRRNQALMEILLAVDATPVHRSGAWTVETEGGLPCMVLVENGRICWAAAPGSRKRLTELVCERAHIDPAQMEVVYQHCREQGRPIGQALVESNVIHADELRAVLFDQTVDALIAMADGTADAPAAPEFAPHRGLGYKPQFTFSVLEVLTAAVTRANRLDVEPIGDRLRRTTGSGFGAAFLEDGDQLTPAVALGHAQVGELDAVGRWAKRALTRARVATALAPRSNAFSGPKGCLVAWREDGWMCVASSSEEGAWSRMMSEVTRAPRLAADRTLRMALGTQAPRTTTASPEAGLLNTGLAVIIGLDEPAADAATAPAGDAPAAADAQSPRAFSR